MPYITQERRKLLNDGQYPLTAGELNYALTQHLKKYIKCCGESYQTYNDIVGALENCKQEFYRRVAVPLENQKCFEHGDVYD